ncbi:uncharacterized protein LOC125195372 [Salvia hispanica]|uniref:uncharacterized protein LOC125195372 n=1 Tax=Salvia hispanica TaxID=49212 RepID=UPI002009A0E4|nr:uncharacterized protein LOC125195372 [Salvia hispanica]
MSNPNPWLMLRPTFDRSRGGMVYNFYNLEDNEVVRINKYGPGPDPPEHPDDEAEVVGSSHGWLALKNHRNNELFLSNPMTHRHIKLPPIDSLPNPEFNLDNCSRSANVSKLILSASPDDADCRAMVAFGWSGRLAFCRPGHSRDWAPIGQLFMEREREGKWYDYKYARSYDDFVFSSKSNVFTCLTSSNIHTRGLEDWDLTSIDSPKIDWIRRQGDEKEENNDDNEEMKQKQHLVYAEQTGELFIVNRLIQEGTTRRCDVYRIEKEKGGWTNIRPCSLQGIALFVGTNHSFAVSAPHIMPNSIYYADGDDVGIYDCDDETFSNCYYPDDADQALDDTDDTPIWFTPMLT